MSVLCGTPGSSSAQLGTSRPRRLAKLAGTRRSDRMPRMVP
ncbi:hypothetical protein ART_3294 [Arthrobacter sp. PAMC 25486]|nr:hypothetical protein ART_3294 [Arthrobacter sp. PAMC 25486]